MAVLLSTEFGCGQGGCTVGTHSQATCCRHGRVTERARRRAPSSTATGSRRSTLTSAGF